MPLTLLLYRGSDLTSRLIGVVEGSTIVHVAITDGSGWLIEANSAGVWARPVDGGTAQRWSLPVTEAQAASIWAWLKQQIGTGYDWIADLDDGVRLVSHIELGLADRHRYNCSGLLAAACQQAGWYPFGQRPAAFITPADWDALSHVS